MDTPTAGPAGRRTPGQVPGTAAGRQGSAWAWTVTNLFSPAVLVSVYLLLLPLRRPEITWLQAVLATVFITGLPWLALIWMKRSGKVTDLHVRERSQRWPVFALAGVSLLLGSGALALLGAPAAAFSSVGLILTGLLICLIVNLRWKLSVHTAVAAFIWLSIFSGPAWGPAAALFMTMLVGWSRLEVRHHTPSQVLAGAVLGCLLFLVGLQLP